MTDFNETPGAPRYRRSSGSSISQMWQNPIFKLVVIVVVLAGAAMAGVNVLSGRKEQKESSIPTAASPVAGATQEMTPEYQAALQESDQNRAQAARAEGESAVPTPMNTGVSNPQLAQNLDGNDGRDPLSRFEAMIAQNQGAAPPQAPLPAPPPPQIPPEMVQGMTQAMRQQMDILMRSWQPGTMETVSSGIDEKDVLERSAPQPIPASMTGASGSIRPIVAAGSIYYGQMLMEANSDVPGPIMAQVLTGPLAGGKAIGEFETFRNYLVIKFSTVAFRNKQVEVEALAIDPGTTLGGVATEVDPRYFERVLLPAAAAFVSAYGDALSRPTSTVTISGTDVGNISSQTDEQDSKDAMYAGIKEASRKVSNFLDDEAAATKRLVRVAVGTPIGIFFVKPVCSMEGQCELPKQAQSFNGTAAQANPTTQQ